MKDIYSTVKIVGLPEPPKMGPDSSGSGGKANYNLTTELVKAMMVAKETSGIIQQGPQSVVTSSDLNELKQGL